MMTLGKVEGLEKSRVGCAIQMDSKVRRGVSSETRTGNFTRKLIEGNFESALLVLR